MVIKVISHGNCSDGYASQWSAYKKYGEGPEVEYISWGHGRDAIPDIQDGDAVYICDFSFDRDVLLDWYDKAETLILLDHHISAQEKVGDLHFTHFDMDHSGAWLAWRFFHPEKEVPPIISYVQDRDLWKHELPYSEEINMVIQSYPQDFESWDDLAAQIEDNLWNVIEMGIAITRYKEQLVNQICANSYTTIIEGYEVVVANTPVLQSEVGAQLLEQYPESPFVASIFRTANSEVFSLRSTEDRVDVSKIAVRNGGGGHYSSAGYSHRRKE